MPSRRQQRREAVRAALRRRPPDGAVAGFAFFAAIVATPLRDHAVGLAFTIYFWVAFGWWLRKSLEKQEARE